MGKRQGWLDRHQNLALVAFIVAGFILADGILLAPIHEWGHKHFAENIEGQEATIIDWNHTVVERATPYNLLAGYENEIVTFLIAFAVLFVISSPYSVGMRRHYFHLGFPLAYATWSWIKPLTMPVGDMIARPEWTSSMRGTLFSDYAIWMAIAWGALLIGRVYIARKLGQEAVK